MRSDDRRVPDEELNASECTILLCELASIPVVHQPDPLAISAKAKLRHLRDRLTEEEA